MIAGENDGSKRQSRDHRLGKVTGYLLNVSHKRGAAKARLLLSVGYRSDAPQVPEVDDVAFDLYSDVILTRDVGTVVERHVVPGVVEEGYSVEFLDMTGNTVAIVTLPAGALRVPTPADRPAARALSA